MINEKGFRAVALEADWPDIFRVHRFVTGRSEDASAAKALSDFRAVVDSCWEFRASGKEKGKGSAVGDPADSLLARGLAPSPSNHP